MNIPIFTKIYEKEEWGKTYRKEFSGSSGNGSTIDYNIKEYIPFIKKFIQENNCKKIVDLGCGDWQSSYLIYQEMNVEYIGYDAYQLLITTNQNKYPMYKFYHIDIVNDKEKIESGDLCILKDVLQHLPNKDIDTLLSYLIDNKKFKYIIICNCRNQELDNKDIVAGAWRQLTANMNPLKKFNPKILFNYNTKEVSLISN